MTARRFVVLRHGSAAGAHHDLMLEREREEDPEERALRTWRSVDETFPLGRGEVLEPLGDHRRHYLSFEGDIGGGRGVVKRVEEGTWEREQESCGELIIRLAGARLNGRYRLSRGGSAEFGVRRAEFPDAEPGTLNAGIGELWRFEKINDV